MHEHDKPADKADFCPRNGMYLQFPVWQVKRHLGINFIFYHGLLVERRNRRKNVEIPGEFRLLATFLPDCNGIFLR